MTRTWKTMICFVLLILVLSGYYPFDIPATATATWDGGWSESNVVMVSISKTGDVDWDGEVTSDDLALLVEVMGLTNSDEAFMETADFDRDGEITSDDLTILVSML